LVSLGLVSLRHGAAGAANVRQQLVGRVVPPVQVGILLLGDAGAVLGLVEIANRQRLAAVAERLAGGVGVVARRRRRDRLGTAFAALASGLRGTVIIRLGRRQRCLGAGVFHVFQDLARAVAKEVDGPDRLAFFGVLGQPFGFVEVAAPQ